MPTAPLIRAAAVNAAAYVDVRSSDPNEPSRTLTLTARLAKGAVRYHVVVAMTTDPLDPHIDAQGLTREQAYAWIVHAMPLPLGDDRKIAEAERRGFAADLVDHVDYLVHAGRYYA